MTRINGMIARQVADATRNARKHPLISTTTLELPEHLPCRRCDKLVGAKQVIGGYENVHVETGERHCVPGNYMSGMASPVDHCRKCAIVGENHAHCPDCGALDEYSITDTNWGIDYKCTACGHKRYFSIGD